MTKQEKIQEAWDNLDGLNTEIWASYWNYEKAKAQGINEDGYITVYGYELGKGSVPSTMRPPQLKGIETNNGWKRIEGQHDLPDIDTDYWVIYKGEVTKKSFNHHLPRSVEFWTEHVTHYQPIVKPLKPLY